METLLIHKFIQWTIMGRTISTSNALSPIQCIWHLEQCFCIQCELMFTSMRTFTQLQLVEALVATNISYNLIIDRVTIQFLLKLEWLSYFLKLGVMVLFFKTWLDFHMFSFFDEVVKKLKWPLDVVSPLRQHLAIRVGKTILFI